MQLGFQLAHPGAEHCQNAQHQNPCRRKGPAQCQRDQDCAADPRLAAAAQQQQRDQQVVSADAADITDVIEEVAATVAVAAAVPRAEAVQDIFVQTVIEDAAATEPVAADVTRGEAALDNSMTSVLNESNVLEPNAKETVVMSAIENPEEVVVFATAVFENSPQKDVTQDDFKSLEKLMLSENHLKENISRIEAGQQTNRQFRNGCYKHTLDLRIFVKTRKLWENARSYIWRNLGQNEWAKRNGESVKLVRIHVKS